MPSGLLLFPQYLNQGSSGRAVAALQLVLVVCGYNSDAIVIDGDYGEQTAIGVKELQRELEVEEDGNFGPATRAACAENFHIDFDALPADLFAAETRAVGP